MNCKPSPKLKLPHKTLVEGRWLNGFRGWDIYCLSILLGIQSPPVLYQPSFLPKLIDVSLNTGRLSDWSTAALYSRYIPLQHMTWRRASQYTQKHVGLPNFTALRIHSTCGQQSVAITTLENKACLLMFFRTSMYRMIFKLEKFSRGETFGDLYTRIW